MKKIQIAIMAIGFAVAFPAHAALLFDRGLPTTNLNNAAGANRANVAWVDGGYATGNYTLVGDTFKNTSAQTWNISQITLWSIQPFSTATLWGGSAGSVSLLPGSGVVSLATYANGSTYQGTGGAYYTMSRIDFAVSIILAPGQTYEFFLDGTGATYTVPFAHASNAALSGSPQDGADDLMLNGVILSGNFVQGSETLWTSLGNGWDKASDLNVQVFGTPVPEPTTMIAGALLLLPFAASTLRILRRKRTA